MSAGIGDLITETYNGGNPVITTVSSPRAMGGTSLTGQSLENWPTNTAVHFQTYQATLSNGVLVKTSGTQTDWKGIVSGSSVDDLTWQGGNADAGNSIGDYMEMMPTYSWAQNLATGLEVLHNNDGTWKDGAVLNQPTIADFTNAPMTHANQAVSAGGPVNVTGLYNPYKFFVYRNASYTSSSGNIIYDAKVYDTSDNYNLGTGNFTAMIDGFYQFAALSIFNFASTGSAVEIFLTKNGSPLVAGDIWVSTYNSAFNEAAKGLFPPIQLNAGDTASITGSSNLSMQVGNTPFIATWFSGYLMSQT